MVLQRFYWFAGLIFLLVFALFSEAQAKRPPFGVTLMQPQKEASNFELPDLQNKMINIRDFKGRAVLLNFWASWCSPCLEEMPSLGKLHERYDPRGLVIVGVALDFRVSPIQRSVNKFQIPFLVLHDAKNKVSANYGARALPMTFLINREGLMVGIVRGARNWDSPEAHAWIEELLEGKLDAQSDKIPIKSSLPKEKSGGEANTDTIFAQMKITAPKEFIYPGKAFALKIQIISEEGPDNIDFEPPETGFPKEIEFVSMGTSTYVQNGKQIYDYDLYLLPNKRLSARKLTLGPFDSVFYTTDGNQGVLSSAPITLTLKQNPFLQASFLIPFLGTLLGLWIGMKFFFGRKRKAKIAFSPAKEEEVKLALDEADQLRVRGSPKEFYEKLLELARKTPDKELVQFLEKRLQEILYGGIVPETWQLADDYKKISRELTKH